MMFFFIYARLISHNFGRTIYTKIVINKNFRDFMQSISLKQPETEKQV